MATFDPYRPIADALVLALQAANGDVDKEKAAITTAIAGYVEIAEGGDPAEIGLAEYFVEDGSVENPPALERVPGASEADQQRWRDMLLDLAGY